jgi:hypothetical protein
MPEMKRGHKIEGKGKIEGEKRKERKTEENRCLQLRLGERQMNMDEGGLSETLISTKEYGVAFQKRAVFVALFSSGDEMKYSSSIGRFSLGLWMNNEY